MGFVGSNIITQMLKKGASFLPGWILTFIKKLRVVAWSIYWKTYGYHHLSHSVGLFLGPSALSPLSEYEISKYFHF